MKSLGYPYRGDAASAARTRTAASVKVMSVTISIEAPATHSTQLAIAWDVLAAACNGFVKLSALFFYRRIFCAMGASKWFHRVSIASIVLIALWIIAYLLLPILQCGAHIGVETGKEPYKYHEKYCFIQKPYYYSLVISNLVLDVWILLLPIPRVCTTRIRLVIRLTCSDLSPPGSHGETHLGLRRIPFGLCVSPSLNLRSPSKLRNL